MRLVRPAVVIALALALTGGSALAAAKPPATFTKKLYLSQLGCGSTAEDPYLLPAPGNEDSGCGVVAGLPVSELDYMTGATVDDVGTPYASTSKTAPFKLDAAKKVTGQLVAESWFGVGGFGTVAWDYRLVGTTTANKVFDFGSYSAESSASGEEVTTPFTIPVPKAANGLTFKSFVFTVWLHGLNMPYSAMGLGGKSFIVIPGKK
jgi:hypothetical protein